MSARAMGSGTISFGLVNIPVKVFSATDSGGKISFNQLHADKKIRLKQQMYDPESGEIVPRDKIIKGYEFEKDKYVIVTEDELEKLELATSRSMDITEFVPLDTVDPLYFDSGYYLGPDKGAERAYKLLAKALEEARFAAVAKYTNRGRQSLIVLRPLSGALVMQQLRYDDEVKKLGDIPIPDANVTEAELGLARQFIGAMAKPKFDITQYKDEYRERLRDLLDKKVKGEAVELTPMPAPQAKVVDLMEALKASLAKSSGAAPAPVAVPAPVAAPVAAAPVLAAVPNPPSDEERKPPHRAPGSEDAAAAPAKKSRKKTS
jgi:DNA end-binding protein Ku